MPYKADWRMGLNHQMSSLSCAMNEAAYLGRTLVIPHEICTDSKHNRGEACESGQDSTPAPRTVYQANLEAHITHVNVCRSSRLSFWLVTGVPFESLFDLELIDTFVSVRLGNSSAAGFTTMRSGCESSCARSEYPCDQYPHLQRRQNGFWFSACLRQTVDTTALARRAETKLAMPSSYTRETAPSLAFLRSGDPLPPQLSSMYSAGPYSKDNRLLFSKFLRKLLFTPYHLLPTAYY